MLGRFGREIAEAWVVRVEDDLEIESTPSIGRKDTSEDSTLEAGSIS